MCVVCVAGLMTAVRHVATVQTVNC